MHDHFFLSLEAAINGTGIALAPRTIVNRDLVEGRLVVAFPEIALAGPGFYGLYSADVLLEQALVRAAGADIHFAHALIRDGVYASLLKPRRLELHGRAAAYYRDRDTVLHAERLEQAEDLGAVEHIHLVRLRTASAREPQGG